MTFSADANAGSRRLWSIPFVAPTLSRRQVLALSGSFSLMGVASFLESTGSAYAASLPGAAEVLNKTVPKRMPVFDFMDQDRRLRSLKNYQGRGLVVNLWATWCIPCLWELPTLAALNKMLSPNDIQVLPIAVASGGADKIDSYFVKNHIEGLPVLVDTSATAFAALNTNVVPLTIIINRSGELVAYLEGGADWGTAATALKVRNWTCQ